MFSDEWDRPAIRQAFFRKNSVSLFKILCKCLFSEVTVQAAS